MYKIALLEDEKEYARALEKTCHEVLGRLGFGYTLQTFLSGEALWQAVEDKGEQFDLYLLDILMEGVNGIDLARQIRNSSEHNKKAAIIFITNSRDFSIAGHDVEALNYLLKPLDTEKLANLVATDYNKRFRQEYWLIDTGAEKLRFAKSEVISLETSGRKVEITLVNSSVLVPGKLTDLIKNCPDLVRCHKAYAVNISNIRKLTRSDAIAKTGKVIPVSRNFYHDVQAAFILSLRGL